MGQTMLHDPNGFGSLIEPQPLSLGDPTNVLRTALVPAHIGNDLLVGKLP